MTIWCNIDLPEQALEELREGVGQHRLVLGKDCPADGVDVVFGQPDPEAALSLAGLRWIQVTSAGYTRYDTDLFRSRLAGLNSLLTNSSSVFDEPCAQHLLAFILAFARQIPKAMREQLGDRGWSGDRFRQDSRLLADQTILIVGYGAIAQRFIELIAPFRVKVIAVRRKIQGNETVPTYPIEELGRLLATADHVANILPANASTDGLFDDGIFASMKSGAFFYNIGRGTTVRQDALISALESGAVGGAYLDVTDPEPLATDDPLWDAPNCFITPHTAGGHAGEWGRLVAHFLRNLARLESGEELLDRIM